MWFIQDRPDLVPESESESESTLKHRLRSRSRLRWKPYRLRSPASKVIWGADFDSDTHFALKRLQMRPRNHRVIKGQWRHMTQKLFFEFLAPKNNPWAFKNHRNVFYLSQGTRSTLKFCSGSIRNKVIGDHVFPSLFGTWPASEVTGWPRPLSLYIDRFVTRRATRSFFSRSFSSIKVKRHGGSYQPPLCRGRMRNGLCRRGSSLDYVPFHSVRCVSSTCRPCYGWAREGCEEIYATLCLTPKTGHFYLSVCLFRHCHEDQSPFSGIAYTYFETFSFKMVR